MLPYGTGFIITQPLTHYLINRVPLTRIVPSLAFLKGVTICFNELFLSRVESHSILNAYALLEGLTDSAFLAVLVVFNWSWFTLEQLPVRVLIGFCGFTIVRGLWLAFIKPLGFSVDGDASAFYAILCFALTVGGCNLVTTPKEVTWLEAHKKVLYERRAAGHNWKTLGGAFERPLWKVRGYFFGTHSFILTVTSTRSFRVHSPGYTCLSAFSTQ